MEQLGIVEVVAAAMRTRATTSGTRRSPRTRWPCEASKVPTFFDGAQDDGGYLVCGAYLMNIEDTRGATSIVVALVRK